MKRSATGLAGLVILTLVAIPAIAQRGGDRGGRGRDAGGDFRVRMLQRMDANGNGTIEPNEAQGCAQGFVERMARDAGLEPGRPLPISQLTGSGDALRGDSQSQRNGSTDRTNSEQDEYPSVPIFGDDTVQTFGLSPLTLAGRIVDLEKKYDRRVLESVNRTMDRYDKNKNGILDHNEWSGVSWCSDPRESDLDKDGMLTKAEMAESTAKRYSDDEQDRGRRSGGRDDRGGGRGDDQDRGRAGSSGRDEGGGRGGSGGGRQGRGRAAGGGEGRGGRGRGGFGGGFDPTSFVARMDENGDGKIGPDEVDERRRAFLQERFQIDLSKPVEIEAIRRQFQQRNEGGDRNAQGNDEEANKVKQAYRVSGSEQLKGRKSYRSIGPALPPKLPDWWNDRDNDSDGQVSLAEFAKTTDTRVMSEFSELDVNGDGLITAKEAVLNEK